MLNVLTCGMCVPVCVYQGAELLCVGDGLCVTWRVCMARRRGCGSGHARLYSDESCVCVVWWAGEGEGESCAWLGRGWQVPACALWCRPHGT